MEKKLAVRNISELTYGNFLEAISSYTKNTNDKQIKSIGEAIILAHKGEFYENSLVQMYYMWRSYYNNEHPVQLMDRLIDSGDIKTLKKILITDEINFDRLMANLLNEKHFNAIEYLAKQNQRAVSAYFSKHICNLVIESEPIELEFILRFATNLNVVCSNNALLTEEVVKTNKLENLKLLVSHGAKIEKSILMHAPYDRHLRSGVIEYLINNGADPDYNENDNSPLLKATAWRQFELAKFLVSNFAVDINIAKDGWTPLLYALKYKEFVLAEKLIDHGATIYENFVQLPQSPSLTVREIYRENTSTPADASDERVTTSYLSPMSSMDLVIYNEGDSTSQRINSILNAKIYIENRFEVSWATSNLDWIYAQRFEPVSLHDIFYTPNTQANLSFSITYHNMESHEDSVDTSHYLFCPLAQLDELNETRICAANYTQNFSYASKDTSAENLPNCAIYDNFQELFDIVISVISNSLFSFKIPGTNTPDIIE